MRLLIPFLIAAAVRARGRNLRPVAPPAQAPSLFAVGQAQSQASRAQVEYVVAPQSDTAAQLTKGQRVANLPHGYAGSYVRGQEIVKAPLADRPMASLAERPLTSSALLPQLTAAISRTEICAWILLPSVLAGAVAALMWWSRAYGGSRDSLVSAGVEMIEGGSPCKHAACGVAASEQHRLAVAVLASEFDERKMPAILCAASLTSELEDDDVKAAEMELAALEDSLEALESELDEEMDSEARMRQESLDTKVDELVANAPSAVSANSYAVPLGSGTDVALNVAVCGLESQGLGSLLVSRLAAQTKSAKQQHIFVDLRNVATMSFEKVDELLQDCDAMVVCPDPAEGQADTLDVVKQGLTALLASAPPQLQKVVLVSHAGAQSTKGGFNLDSFFGKREGTNWDDLEDVLTSTARKRTSNRMLRYVIVRAGDRPSAGSAPQAVKCLPADDALDGATTSMEMLAEALFKSLSFEVNTSFSLIDQGEPATPPNWAELLLPYVGPEIWRHEVADARRAATFVQGWAQEFFGDGKRAIRFGVKTPVEVCQTQQGVIIKFRPLSTDRDTSFEELEDGGVEFIAEAPTDSAARLRARRCAYGWKVAIKENSEAALLSKFAKDWEEVVSEM